MFKEGESSIGNHIKVGHGAAPADFTVKWEAGARPGPWWEVNGMFLIRAFGVRGDAGDMGAGHGVKWKKKKNTTF